MKNKTLEALLLEGPAHALPPGHTTPNFNNPPNHRALSLATLTICLLITTSMTFMRMYVKIFTVRKMHLEDWLLPLAFLFEVAHITPAWVIYTFDPVYHQWDMRMRDLIRLLMNLHIAYIFYDLTILVLKLCIMLQFLRIFVPSNKRGASFWITHTLIWVNSLFYLGSALVETFSCKPMEKRWNPLVTEGKCINVLVVHPLSASLNFVLDAVILLWTQRVIWSLHMTRERRWKIAVPFMAGIMALVFAGLRVFTSVKLNTTSDIAYWGALMGLSTFSEVASGFLVLSLPVLPHLYKNMRKYMGFSSNHSHRMTLNPDRPRRLPRSWLHISQDSVDDGNRSPRSQKHLGHGITRTDQVIIEFMSLNSTDSILPSIPEHALSTTKCGDR
ncbi:hypothetical protein K458DRAFT_427301 [Lentithecium fluviatile CBS 122367]|uniref:Rhodopsin domain-containing protein n=1 Tax=Lentithecium fluviatile CBS 122367 TaxID=1168545 RepID=A0A6G1JFU3_9PLEO|nr:hypothetical protein K458DRAFT_427301 [Lentithecium fluviatile CBS 122367]